MAMRKNNNSLAILIISVFLISVFLPGSVAAQPSITSQYYCLMDSSSGQLLLGRNMYVTRPVASTTKMMTAILVMDYAGLNEMATVSQHADRTAEYTIGLREGQTLPVSELLKAALICSANDAAVVLAEHVAGDEALFAHLMSCKALLIGAANTHFVNASGLPASNHFSTAYDLAQMGRYALTYPAIKKLVRTPRTEFHHPGYQKPIIIRNTNGLLNSYRGAEGIKTGTTDAAGKCLVAATTRNRHQLIAVVLKSGDRQGDCWRLLDYGFARFAYKKLINKNEPFKRIQVIGGKTNYVNVYPAEDLWLWIGENTPDIEKKVKMQYFVMAPAAGGRNMGELNVYAQGKLVKVIDLVLKKPVERKHYSITKIYEHFFK
ncbi:MAG TPA: D-alanyl-D-alanine carboxypeptidase family protein [Syntrophomonadaceae bacterium]|nr:D-alanyl-D-alanine carboxypeptidase family protein [Syntrophomonadaceae bacterium]